MSPYGNFGHKVENDNAFVSPLFIYNACVACTWCDNDAAGFFDYVNCLVQVDLSVSANNLHGLTPRCGGGAVPTQDHIGQGAVHSLGRE